VATLRDIVKSANKLLLGSEIGQQGQVFPRGRIERAGVVEYTVFHADDFAGTGIAPERIEKAFEFGTRMNGRILSIEPS